MTDSEFLDDLESRAAKSVAPAVSTVERKRLASFDNLLYFLDGFYVGDSYTVAKETLIAAVQQARVAMTKRITTRLKA